MAEPSGNPPGPPHACRTRTLRMSAKTPLASDKTDAPAACAVPFPPYCGGVVTRTRNISEYMLDIACTRTMPSWYSAQCSLESGTHGRGMAVPRAIWLLMHITHLYLCSVPS